MARVRKSLGASAVRKHAVDGGDFHTLPVIVDHAGGGETVGDSLDIALYLDARHPGAPALFPPHTAPLHRVFNAAVDKAFTDHVALGVCNIPFNPATAEVSKAEFSRRAGGIGWDQMRVGGEARAAMLRSFEAALGELARLYVRRDEGPFLEGATLMYADLIVGGWLQMMKEVLPEWEGLRGWHGGLWGTVHDALSKYAQAD